VYIKLGTIGFFMKDGWKLKSVAVWDVHKFVLPSPHDHHMSSKIAVTVRNP
jgi:hypothetical protein